jgi:hypothetical protein
MGHEPRRYKVVWDDRAVREFRAITDRRARQKILTACDLLGRLGPKLVMPHARKVQGAAMHLFELRPGGGQDLNRPLYYRRDGDTFIILAIAPEAIVNPKGFRRSVEKAATRASDW